MSSAWLRASSRAPLLQRAARWVSAVHRWLGIGFCLLLAMWFGTGFVMMYVPFPALGDAARLAATPPLSLDTVSVPPAVAAAMASAATGTSATSAATLASSISVADGAAATSAAAATPAAAGKAASAAASPVARLRLVATLGRPRYLATLDDGSVQVIDADNGARPAPLDAAAAGRVASAFAQRPVRAISSIVDHDQWVVHQRFDASRPFYRIDIDDTAGTELYVSVRLGQVVQRTTRFERGWNYVGAVVHWIYPTVLRKHHAAWDQVVWWLALGALTATATGYALGVLRWLNLRRSGRPGISPFRGWRRWHHIIGLTGGLFALTWLFSGWLSMDHGRLFSLDQPGARRGALLRGATLASAFGGLGTRDLAVLDGARELEFFALAGQGYIIARNASAPDTVTPVAAGRMLPAIPAIPDIRLLRAVQAAYAPAPVLGIAAIAPHDPYARTRSDPLPDTARRVLLADACGTWVHIDARSGTILSQMDASRRLYRWLFAGLHSFDFPWLDGAGVVRQLVMLAALAGGLALSVSAVVLGWRRVGRARVRRT